MRIQIIGDSNLIVNWMNGRWKINNQKFRRMIQKTQNILDKVDIRPMADHLDMFQHVYREWNQEADRLTHVAREKGATWNSYAKGRAEKIEPVRSFFDGGVSSGGNSSSKNKKGSACVIQVAERIEEYASQMKWKTIIEVARVLPNDASVTQAECTATVKAAKAVCCSARTGNMCFDLDGKLIEEYKNKTRRKGRNGRRP